MGDLEDVVNKIVNGNEGVVSKVAIGDQYILNEDHQPTPEPNIIKWGKWMQGNSSLCKQQVTKRFLGIFPISNSKVSTVFLGIDHNYSGEGDPVLFETTVFGGACDGYQDRCSTWYEATVMHAFIRSKVQEYL